MLGVEEIRSLWLMPLLHIGTPQFPTPQLCMLLTLEACWKRSLGILFPSCCARGRVGERETNRPILGTDCGVIRVRNKETTSSVRPVCSVQNMSNPRRSPSSGMQFFLGQKGHIPLSQESFILSMLPASRTLVRARQYF